jgi:rubredoxin
MIAVVHRGNGRLVCCNRPMLAAGEEQAGAAPAAGQKLRAKDMSGVKETGVQQYWKCTNCNYVMEAAQPPDRCPSCSQKCPFVDVTCYIPECGLVGADPRLIQS